ncbi:hypothetical protein [Fusobacterium varium]|uniref:hypothetical protein n=1 Tax=Fusobacterium varium TaxID=856 RepID=UPI000E425CA6|nr:hypothetical protein [Fusobacterium varium]RGJ30417.1 hypothetical protein DXD66_05005 [Fusobacterium varium]
MELIKVTGPAKNRDTLVSLKWNNGNVGHIAIKKDKKLVLLGKTEHGYFVSKNQLSLAVEQAVRRFIITACPSWIESEIVAINEDIEKEKRFRRADIYGLKGKIYDSNIKSLIYKKEYLKNALSVIKDLKKSA